MMKYLFAFALLLGSTLLLHAQSVNDEADMQDFARRFMAAYNAGDVAALRSMYTDDAVRIDADGRQIQGGDNIAAYFADQFRLNNATLLLRQKGLAWSDAQQAWAAIGTFEIYGITHVYDIPIDRAGHYANTMKKEDGRWKITRTVLSPLVRTLVCQEVADAAEWQSVLRGFLFMAPVHAFEIGTLQNAPGTAYALLQWSSREAAEAFFASPGWQNTIEVLSTSPTKPPVVMFLEAK
ncbi:MAG: hypothetical protein OHK0039_06040 [Bacteroidia bacterium]